MKLSKEDVYIDLKGKSNEDRIEILNYLKSIKEETEVLIHKEIYRQNTLEFYNDEWFTDESVWDKTEVTFEQLKEIMKPIKMTKRQEIIEEAKKRGYTHNNFKCLIGKIYNGIKNIENWHYEIVDDSLYTNTEGNGGNVVYKGGVWAEIIKPMETLQEKEQRLLKELEEVRKEMEDGRIKEGDWVVINETETVFKVNNEDVPYIDDRHIKITDSVLLERLNRLFK